MKLWKPNLIAQQRWMSQSHQWKASPWTPRYAPEMHTGLDSKHDKRENNDEFSSFSLIGWNMKELSFIDERRKFCIYNVCHRQAQYMFIQEATSGKSISHVIYFFLVIYYVWYFCFHIHALLICARSSYTSSTPHGLNIFFSILYIGSSSLKILQSEFDP